MTHLVDAVVIGRNEGARLAACLASLTPQVRHVVYVDSGSHDDSVAIARAAGAQIVALDMSQPFTAARARNAGFAALGGDGGSDAAPFVQFVDGDCRVDPHWILRALTEIETRDELALVCGRRRETNPEASVYNRLCDIEWNTPIGEARFCGGDALIRTAAFRAVDGFDATLIAGEEPDLCLRLRGQGWRIWRLDAEMTLHDADMHRFGQWWRRCARAGHAFAEGAARHGHTPERLWMRETRRAVIWGFALPITIFGLALLCPVALLLLLVYPLQIMRMGRKNGSWEWAGYNTLAKLPEAIGVLRFWRTHLSGKRARIIEYK